MRRLLVLAALLVSLPAGAVTMFDGGGAYYFSGTDDAVVTNDSVLDILAPANVGSLSIGTSASSGYVNVRGGAVESSVLTKGYVGISAGSVGSIDLPTDSWGSSIHLFGGEVGNVSAAASSSSSVLVFGGALGTISAPTESTLSLNLFDGTVQSVVLGSGSVRVSGGSLGSLRVHWASAIEIFDGSLGNLTVFSLAGSLVDIHGGVIGSVNVGEWGNLAIDGGAFLNTETVLVAYYKTAVQLSGGAFEPGAEFRLVDNSLLYVTGSDLALSEPIPHENGWRSTLTGALLDGNPISVHVLYNPAPLSAGDQIWLNGVTLCSNGVDDDGDGLVDAGADPGCYDSADPSERGIGLSSFACDDGIDNDGDGLIDYVAAGGGDPGCHSPTSSRETTQCQDGLNNDFNPGIDFDGGASLDLDQDGRVDAQFNLAIPLVGAPDPQCTSAWVNREKLGGCGLGFELVVLGPLLARLRRRHEAARLGS